MSELIIANSIAPIVVSKEGGILIFISIFPVEMVIIWLVLQPPISRLFIRVLVANIATSILGIPFLFMVSNQNAAGHLLPFSFLISFLIESLIYKGFFKRSGWRILVASFASNLVSYIMCASFLIPFSLNSENFSYDTRPEFSATLVISYRLRDLESLYSEEPRFASRSDLRSETLTRLRSETLTRSYKFDIQSEPEKATIVATAKRNDIASLRGTIFIIKDKDKLNFIKGICKTDKPSMTPPEMPQLVKGEFQCPPGSLDESERFGLRQR
jgi:hypothetical protein